MDETIPDADRPRRAGPAGRVLESGDGPVSPRLALLPALTWRAAPMCCGRGEVVPIQAKGLPQLSQLPPKNWSTGPRASQNETQRIVPQCTAGPHGPKSTIRTVRRKTSRATVRSNPCGSGATTARTVAARQLSTMTATFAVGPQILPARFVSVQRLGPVHPEGEPPTSTRSASAGRRSTGGHSGHALHRVDRRPLPRPWHHRGSAPRS